MELRPFRKRVALRMQRNSTNPAWAILGARWSALVASARMTMDQWTGGQPMARHEAQAAQCIINIAASVEAREVIEVALAMYLLAESYPRRFRDDRAFEVQLVRRVRALAPCHSGSYHDHQTQRVRKVFRDVPPRVLRVLGEMLKETFGAAGLIVGRLEMQEVTKRVEEDRTLYAALGVLA